ncbi:defense against restriction DarA-related protein [Thauera humireducens]|jgi:hypothetical protein
MEYAYGLQFRPASIGAVPPGLFEVRENGEPGAERFTRHGVIVYDRPLTESEIRAFELVVLADDIQRDTLATEVASKLATYGQSYLELWREDQGMFESIVADRLADVRPYSVFVGQVPVFAGKVAEKLATLVEIKNGEV